MKAPDVKIIPCAFADVSFSALLIETRPEQLTYTFCGKTGPRPRQEAWFGENPYTYSGQTLRPRLWTPILDEIRSRVEDLAGEPFDSCLVNYYPTGRHHVSWHADDEPEVGPVVASVSLGAPRRFAMKLKAGGSVHAWDLGHGDLFLMHAGVQDEWLHCIRKTSKRVGPRLSLTFRQDR